MKNTILILTILLTLAGTLIPAQSVQAAPPDAPLRDFVTTNDNNLIVTYSGAGWVYADELEGYFYGDAHTSAVTSEYVELRFFGSTISLIVATGPDHGQADIYIDTELDETVDLYSATPATQETIYSKIGLTVGYHTIKVVVKGEKDPSSTGYAVSIDYFRFTDAAQSPPPGTNDIECRTNPAAILCIQDTTQSITLVATDAILYVDFPLWKLNAGGIGTVYARLTQISEKWMTSPWSGAGEVTFRFGVNRPDVQQTRVIGTYWPNGWQWFPPVSVADFEDSYDYIAAGNYSTIIDSTQPAPQPHFQARFSYVLTLQTVPFVDGCVDQYTIQNTEGPFIIDPTYDVAPGTEQMRPVTVGQTYMVRVGGDGWHDGTAADEWGAEFSWDNDTWYDLQDTNCVQEGEGFYKYTAIIQAPESAIWVYFRARDDEGDFGDNYMDANEQFIYTISSVAFTGSLSCEDQYTYDPGEDWVASALVPANVSYVQVLDDPGEGPLVHGDWYVVQIAYGSWQDDGAAPDRFDARYSWGNVATGDMTPTVIWNLMGSGGDGVYCATTEDDLVTVYVQAQAPIGETEAQLWLRVNDALETFETNTGSLFIDVYRATFTRFPVVCETTFGNQGYIGRIEIPANAENGVALGTSSGTADASLGGTYRLAPGGWYMIETTNGPWGWVGSTHSELSYDVAVNWGSEWVSLQDWAEGTCLVEVDSLGHQRVYFRTPTAGTAEYKFRVGDTGTWFNNIGNMGLELYSAYDMDISNEDGSCDYETGDQIGDTLTVSATDSDGEWIGFSVFSDTVYAFKIEGSTSAWNEQAGGADLYAMQISVDNGGAWYDVPTGYSGILCYYQEGNDTWIFMNGGIGYQVRFRVDSETFSNNTGSMTVKSYQAWEGNGINPWATCVDGLALWVIDEYIEIDEKLEEGEYVPLNDAYLDDDDYVGFYIKIDWQSGPWYDGEPDNNARYSAQLSSDNGTTWYPLDSTNPDITCARWDQLRLFANVLFTPTEDQTWKIRVNDVDTATFQDNTGYLAYKLYVATAGVAVPDCLVETNNPECIDWSQFPSGVLINGNDICLAAALRPTPPASLIDVPAWLGWVGSWINYASVSFMQYLAWCPRHSDSLLALKNAFKDREPMATLTELASLIAFTRQQAGAYNWEDTYAENTGLLTNGAQGGNDPGGAASSTSNSIIDRIFGGADAGGAWTGGPLISGVQTWTGDAWNDDCSASYEDLIPNAALIEGVCFVASASRLSGASFILQIMLDLVAIAWLGYGLWRMVKMTADFIAGGPLQGSE